MLTTISESTRRALLGLLAVGLIIRLILALAVTHHSFDLQSIEIIYSTLRHHPRGVYQTGRWPYPPGFFPWILASHVLSHLGISFAAWIKLPSILADLALAYAVVQYLAWKGATERAQVLAAAAITLGPVFIIISGYEVQLDSLAILPAFIALIVWQRRPDWVWRGVAVGALIGIGATLKTFPILLLAAFLPSARSWRERIEMGVVAVAIPGITILPWLALTPHETLKMLRYGGIPGAGGLSLVVQPSLAKATMLAHSTVHFSHISRVLANHTSLWYAPFYLVVAALLYRWRTEPALAASIVWLSFYAFSPDFFFQYLIWGIPFFLATGYIFQTIALEAYMTIPHLLFVRRPWHRTAVADVYAALMIAAWAGYLVVLGIILSGEERRHQARVKV